MKPFLPGQRVLYSVTADEAAQIRARRQFEPNSSRGNPVSEGQQYPADVVAVFTGEYANLKVHLDGTDQLWSTSRAWGEGPGTCQETAF
jgi:hypothetical protein